MTSPTNIAVRLEVPREHLARVIEYGMEYGISYWCASVEAGKIPEGKTLDDFTPGLPLSNLAVAPGGVVVFAEHADGEAPDSENLEHDLGEEQLERGLVVLAKESPTQFAEILRRDFDSDTSDLFIQCCIFGEIRYA